MNVSIDMPEESLFQAVPSSHRLPANAFFWGRYRLAKVAFAASGGVSWEMVQGSASRSICFVALYKNIMIHLASESESAAVCLGFGKLGCSSLFFLLGLLGLGSALEAAAPVSRVFVLLTPAGTVASCSSSSPCFVFFACDFSWGLPRSVDHTWASWIWGQVLVPHCFPLGLGPS